MSNREPGPDESLAEGAERGALRPKYRRAFGCITWVNMAVLIFLLAAFLLVLPFRYIGEGEVYSATLLGLAFVGTALILPGMALGAALGARTYRVENTVGARAGAAVGAVAGLASYLFLSLVGDLPLIAAPHVVSLGLLLYALFATGRDLRRRRRAVLLAAALSVLSGAVAFLVDFDPIPFLGALVSAASAAAGGYVGGIGYARAGGDAMIPPGSTIRPRQARRKPR
ncbi:MAG: hypothetical protein AVDCRST_MAG78-214 [uncultured Rubrobacteraceae bacterium]|uniref:Uncharacterized protein n=1 Tax=uncultured Rubrobacteraceae bacterium TaxID=349277 RepID=A0A6J4PBD1_9ACTN|nr:MAG: hypothetical protein AVDCRST_MAG78-214 [uncultured Rubrobacteraceae bacterium]